MELSLESLTGIVLGLGLAAATGLRVFLPLLVAAIAARWGLLPLSDGFAWLASGTAIAMLATASIAEILAYYIPGLDHALDVLASPATVAAGTIASASVMVDLPPWVLWPVALIAGGGVAGLTKGTTALVRAGSGAATVGISNPIISTMETLGATGLAALAIALPVIALLLIGVTGYLVYHLARKARTVVFGAR